MRNKVCLVGLFIGAVLSGCDEKPKTAAPVWVTVDDDMAIGREGSSIQMIDTTVLVTGGNLGFEGVSNFAELFDPLHQTWNTAPDLRGILTNCGEVQRQDHQVTPMEDDGTFLITGGRYMASSLSSEGCPCFHNEKGCKPSYSDSYVIFDPRQKDAAAYMSNAGDAESSCSNQPNTEGWSAGWSPLQHLRRKHALHTVNVLGSTVVLIGGLGKTTEETCDVYTYVNSSLDPTNSGNQNPESELFFFGGHTATKFSDDQLLVFGGARANKDDEEPIVNGDILTEQYAFQVDVKSGIWLPVTMTIPPARVGHIAVKLTNGNILIAGGWDKDKTPLQDAWIFDGASFKQIANMNHPHAFAAMAVVESSASVIMAGGFTSKDETTKKDEIIWTATNTVERFDEATNSWQEMPPMHLPRARHSIGKIPPPNNGVGTIFLAIGGVDQLEKGNKESSSAVRTGELLYLNDSCEVAEDCSPNAKCSDGRCTSVETP